MYPGDLLSTPSAYATPQQISSLQDYANYLTKQGMSDTPIRHWSQGVNRMLQALMGGTAQHEADRLNQQRLAATASTVYGGSPYGGSSTMGSASTVPLSTPPYAPPDSSVPPAQLPSSGDAGTLLYPFPGALGASPGGALDAIPGAPGGLFSGPIYGSPFSTGGGT